MGHNNYCDPPFYAESSAMVLRIEAVVNLRPTLVHWCLSAQSWAVRGEIRKISQISFLVNSIG